MTLPLIIPHAVDAIIITIISLFNINFMINLSRKVPFCLIYHAFKSVVVVLLAFYRSPAVFGMIFALTGDNKHQSLR